MAHPPASIGEAIEAATRRLGDGGRARLGGSPESARALVLARLVPRLSRDAGPVACVCEDEASARRLVDQLAVFLDGAVTPHVLPDPAASPYAQVVRDPAVAGARLAALAALGYGDDAPVVLVGSVRAWAMRTLSRDVMDARSLRLRPGQELAPQALVDALLAAGYERTDLVVDPGSFAVRGGIVDLFAPGSRDPVRLDWFGDEVDSMRHFDPETQRSLGPVSHLWIHPVRESVPTRAGSLRPALSAAADRVDAPSSRVGTALANLEAGRAFFGLEALVPALHERFEPGWCLAPAGTRWVRWGHEDDLWRALAYHAEEMAEAFAQARAAHRLVCPPDAFLPDDDELGAWLGGACLELAGAGGAGAEVSRLSLPGHAALATRLQQVRTERHGQPFAPLTEALAALPERASWDVRLVAPTHAHARTVQELLQAAGVPVAMDAEGPAGRVRVQVGRIGEGFRADEDRLWVLGDRDLFGKVARARAPRRAGAARLGRLRPGDHVVHRVHGIGRYDGLEHLTLAGVEGDFLLLQYAGRDRLYLPVVRVGDIEPYEADKERPPRLDRLGGASFAARQARVREAVAQLAEEMLQIYAAREAATRPPYPEPGPDDLAFAATFPYEETPDQAAAIEAVHQDLSGSVPMDRLVCADVGFGKTEVAMRAAFRVALAGRQVAVLAPTTLLVRQHLRTFTERLEAFGVRVAGLHRFMSTAERKATLDGLRSGAVDVVVGTHRVLSKDVRFADLGLVVVDEEQRFGVRHKDRFKKLRAEVDTLTLTATPIPRTLHLSLSGMRPVSLIETPPPDRLSVRTYLGAVDDDVVREAIARELARGGQVFYVVPKILGLEDHVTRLRRLLPEARVLAAHGRMPGPALDRAMTDFVEHRADVLVSTTIVESGLDIPRANTMLIHGADRFGVAQLHQLRGRVGRGRVRAHCYLLVERLEQMTGVAQARLRAVLEHSELGSGLYVARRDLEIRGAGELLGGRQSGRIAAVGFAAYARLLREVVARLRGAPAIPDRNPEVAADVPVYLPADYVPDAGARLDLYRRLAAAASAGDVLALRDEIEDRFGPLPEAGRALCRVMEWLPLGRRLGAQSVELAGGRLRVRLGDCRQVAPEAVARLCARGGWQRRAGDRLALALPTTGRDGALLPDAERLRLASDALAALVATLAPDP